MKIQFKVGFIALLSSCCMGAHSQTLTPEQQPTLQTTEVIEVTQVAELRNAAHTQYYKNGKLKSVENFQEGKYSGIQRYYDNDGQLRQEVEYKDGIQDGICYTLHPNGVIKQRGHYKANKPNGKFTIRDSEKNLLHTIYYKNGEIVDTATDEQQPDQAIDKPKVIAPFYSKGGTKELGNFIINQTKYPLAAYNKKITGRVVVGFLLNEKGEMQDIHIRKSICKVLDDEALRVVRSIPHKWQPGSINGKAQTIFLTLPINFSMHK